MAKVIMLFFVEPLNSSEAKMDFLLSVFKCLLDSFETPEEKMAFFQSFQDSLLNEGYFDSEKVSELEEEVSAILSDTLGD